MKTKTYSLLELLLSSDVGMMLVLFNLLGMLWYEVINHQPLPVGFVSVIMTIWGGKTIHSVTQSLKDKLK